MAYWRFKSYQGKDGNQPWGWLEQQGEDARDYVYSQLFAVAHIEDSPKSEFSDLPGKYVGLSQLSVGFDEPFGIRHLALIGFWEPDSVNFIVVLCFEVEEHSYGLFLEKALDYKRDWEAHQGETYALFPDQDII